MCGQLYTIPPVRSGILEVEEAAKAFVVLEEQEREMEKREREKKNSVDVSYSLCIVGYTTVVCVLCEQDIEDGPVDGGLSSNTVSSSSSENRKDTQRKVLMQLQSIFSHLLEGRLQFHTPQGFWREFRLHNLFFFIIFIN